jgi:hypothetical protein
MSSKSQYYNSQYSPHRPPVSVPGTGLPQTTGSFDSIHLEQVGFVGGLRSHILEEEIVKLEKQGIQMALAEAKNAAIAPDIAGLAVRDFLPGDDFEDGNDNPIQMKNWRQPWSGFYANSSGEFEVYRTNKDTDYDKKVIGIWGVRYVNSGPGRLGNVVSTSEVIFKDSAGNTYDRWQVEGLDVHTELYSFTPIIFTNTRQLRIFHFPKIGASGSSDNIQLIGKVVERRGDNVNGLQHIDLLSTS